MWPVRHYVSDICIRISWAKDEQDDAVEVIRAMVRAVFVTCEAYDEPTIDALVEPAF